MRHSFVVAAVALLCAGGVARADTVTFKNGDKLTGTFVKLAGGNVSIKTENLGDITISMEKVASLTIAEPGVVISKDQKVIRGQVEWEPPGQWKVTNGASSQVVMPADVAAVTSDDTYHKELEASAMPWENWKGQANLGYSVARGNQNTHTLSTLLAATRERPTDLLFTPHFRTNYGLNILLSKAQQDGSTVTSNTVTTNLRQDYLFSPANFVFALAELDHVDAQGLYLQQSYGGGFGRDLLHTKKTLFSLLGGFDYLRQHFDNGSQNSTIEANVGEQLGMQITSRLRLDHHLNFYPDLRRDGQYHFDAAANLIFKVNNHLTANAGAIDLFLTNPPAGSHENNIAVTTGLGVTF